ncbi:MAG: aldolase [Alphaproteobacteria bacterium]|nr:aldolase [Alphaproteobacteria bacterium]
MGEEMRANRVRTALRAGGTAFGTMAFEFFTPGLMGVLAAAGADFVVLDTEHSGAGIDTLKQQLAAARGLDIVPIVRVPGCHYHLIAPVLDAGAMGIMVPMVETAEQARQIAAWCRYRPQGVRGLAFGLAHDDYRGGDPAQKMREANERTLVIALIETATGIANAETIMAVEGIDIGWLGHFDLTATMGIPGQFEHPDFRRAVDDLLAACTRHEKAAGFLATAPEMAEAWRERGFRILGYGTDVSLLQGALRAGLARLRGGGSA